MKKHKLLSLLLALSMVLSLAACGGDTEETKKPDPSTPVSENTDQPSQPTEDVTQSKFYGPIYDEWSDMTDEELFQKALEETNNGKESIKVYATSSKMLKAEEKFEETFPGLDVEIMDMDQDEVLSKCVLEYDSGNILGDVLQAKDVNGEVFFDYY